MEITTYPEMITPSHQWNPQMEGIDKARCDKLPETGQPCELHSVDITKDNKICLHCTVRVGAYYINSTKSDRQKMAKYLKAHKQMVNKAVSEGFKKSRKRRSSNRGTYFGSVCNRNHFIEHPTTGERVGVRYVTGGGCAKCVKLAYKKQRDRRRNNLY